MKISKKNILVTALLGISTAWTFGQTASLKGKIYAAEDSIAISGVIVDLNGKQRVLSNSKGEFNFSKLDAGSYTVRTNHANYRTESRNIEFNGTEEINMAIYLKEGVLDLPEAVVSHVTLTGGEQGIKELPGSAYYLSPKEIEKFNYTDVNRSLRSVPGVNIQEEDGFGSRPSIGLRGTGVERSSKITLMEDGILIAPAPYSAPAAYYFPTFGRMQAVEVLKGSSQIKYGPYTTGGAINLISTQIPDTITARVRLASGSFGFRNLHAFAGNSHDYFGYSVETFQISSDGFKSLDNGASTGFNKSDYLFKFRVNTKSTAKVYQALSLKVGETSEHAYDSYLGLTKADFELDPFHRYDASQKDEIRTKQRQYSASYLIKPAKFITFTTTVYRNEFFRNWYKLDAVKDSTGSKVGIADLLEEPESYTREYGILNGDLSNTGDLIMKGNSRDHYAHGIQTVIGIDFKTGFVKHDLDLGFRYHQDAQDRFQYQDEYQMKEDVMFLTKAGEAGRESNRITSATAAASYLQYKLVIKRFNVTAGLRHEHIYIQSKDYGKNDPTRTGTDLKVSENEVDAFMPGISVDYKINTKLAVFTGVHKGFTPPGATEGAMPEESINYELGLKWYTRGISAQLVGFYNDYANLLGSDMASSGGLGTGDMFNGGKSQVYGFELHGVYDLMRHFESEFNMPLTLAYTYTEGQFMTSFESTFEDWGSVERGDQLPYLAQHQFAANLSLDHARFGVNIGSKYVSEMRSQAGQGPIADDELIPGFFVMDASVAYHLNRNFTVFGTVTNLANEVYVVALRPSGYRPGMPRAFQIGLKARL